MNIFDTEMLAQLIKILKTVKGKITDDSNVISMQYEDPSEFRRALNDFILELETGDISNIYDIHLFFAPTGRLQEHSIENGWGDEYLILSENFDKIYEQLRASLKKYH